MKATRFEFQHQTLLHLLVVGLSLVTYLAGRTPMHGNSFRRDTRRVAFPANSLDLGRRAAAVIRRSYIDGV